MNEPCGHYALKITKLFPFDWNKKSSCKCGYCLDLDSHLQFAFWVYSEENKSYAFATVYIPQSLSLTSKINQHSLAWILVKADHFDRDRYKPFLFFTNSDYPHLHMTFAPPVLILPWITNHVMTKKEHIIKMKGTEERSILQIRRRDLWCADKEDKA